jgi:hypothetical protein
MTEQGKGHGGSKKVGRCKDKCAAYRSAKRREHNKSKRVLQSNGLEACKVYCANKGISMPKRAAVTK